MGLTANELWVLKSIAGSNPVTSANQGIPQSWLDWGILLFSHANTCHPTNPQLANAPPNISPTETIANYA